MEQGLHRKRRYNSHHGRWCVGCVRFTVSDHFVYKYILERSSTIIIAVEQVNQEKLLVEFS